MALHYAAENVASTEVMKLLLKASQSARNADSEAGLGRAVKVKLALQLGVVKVLLKAASRDSTDITGDKARAVTSLIVFPPSPYMCGPGTPARPGRSCAARLAARRRMGSCPCTTPPPRARRSR